MFGSRGKTGSILSATPKGRQVGLLLLLLWSGLTLRLHSALTSLVLRAFVVLVALHLVLVVLLHLVDALEYLEPIVNSSKGAMGGDGLGLALGHSHFGGGHSPRGDHYFGRSHVGFRTAFTWHHIGLTTPLAEDLAYESEWLAKADALATCSLPLQPAR